LNQRFESCEPKWLIRWTTLRRCGRSSIGTKAFGAAHVDVVLRDLVLEDQVVTEGVPGQLAAERVVLVQVGALVQEDHE
jgi:hypothetical protein